MHTLTGVLFVFCQVSAHNFVTSVAVEADSLPPALTPVGCSMSLSVAVTTEDRAQLPPDAALAGLQVKMMPPGACETVLVCDFDCLVSVT